MNNSIKIRYIIHLGLVIFLCCTTWVALWNPIYAKFGIGAAIAACLFSGTIEFVGYLFNRDYQRTNDQTSLGISSLILLASACFTFWGSTLLGNFIAQSSKEEARGKYAAVINAAQQELTDYYAKIDMEKKEFEADKEARKKELDKQEANDIARIGSSDFQRYYIREGKKDWFEENTPNWVDEVQAIRAKYNKERLAISNEKYTPDKSRLQALRSNITRLQDDKGAEIASNVLMGNILVNTIRALDIIGILFALFFIISDVRNPGQKHYIPKHPVSENIITFVINAKETLGHRLSVFDKYDESGIAQADEDEYNYKTGWEAAIAKMQPRVMQLKDELAETTSALIEAQDKNGLLQNKMIHAKNIYEELRATKERVESEWQERVKRVESEWQERVDKRVADKVKAQLADYQVTSESSTRPLVKRVEKKRVGPYKRAGDVREWRVKPKGAIVFKGKTYKDYTSFRGSIRSRNSALDKVEQKLKINPGDTSLIARKNELEQLISEMNAYAKDIRTRKIIDIKSA
jgi:hypothetical protein